MLSRIVAGVVFFLSSVTASLSDYKSASQDSTDSAKTKRNEIAIGLIATGDFHGVYGGEYTPRLHAAIEAFQTREGFARTGVLLPDQQARLKTRADDFLNRLGLQSFEVGSGAASVMVPRALFDTETRTGGGYAFERNDGSLSLRFETVSDQTFEKLYERLTDVRGGRLVGYQVMQPVHPVSSGTFRGRYFYTWFSRATLGRSVYVILGRGTQGPIAIGCDFARKRFSVRRSTSAATPAPTPSPSPGPTMANPIHQIPQERGFHFRSRPHFNQSSCG